MVQGNVVQVTLGRNKKLPRNLLPLKHGSRIYYCILRNLFFHTSLAPAEWKLRALLIRRPCVPSLMGTSTSSIGTGTRYQPVAHTESTHYDLGAREMREVYGPAGMFNL